MVQDLLLFTNIFLTILGPFTHFSIKNEPS